VRGCGTQARRQAHSSGKARTAGEHGRFSLNALHKASGEKKKDQPSTWLSYKKTKELIAELNSQNSGSSPTEVKTGRNGGTFAHEILAV
jgi:hypothetical protein